jgi:hypothetical protein
MATTKKKDNLIDINIGGIEKKRFRINGDDNKILELNTSDLNIASRFSEAYPALIECEKQVTELQESANEDTDELGSISMFSEKLKGIDTKMKELMDFIFDSNVSEICAGNGSMYDPLDGYMRYEVIIDRLSDLYTDNLGKEMKKVQNRMKAHTAKYTK